MALNKYMPKKYRIMGENSGDHPIGTICYDSMKCDYGCANDDTRFTGHEHVSVSLDPNGDYPFFPRGG